jgi:CheY-like chemotaxis protein
VRRKVLLVDDSPTALMLVRTILARGRYDIVTASNGREAVEVAVATRPDVIVMDVMMPECDGVEACRRIRAHQDIGDVPVVLLTTRGEAHSIEAGYASGCNEYMTKPVDAMELLAKVETLLGDGDAPGQPR